MEYIGDENSSSTLDKMIKQKNELGFKDWLMILYNVTDALNYMHTKGFLHCDLKSNNIVVYNNKGYLIDFGKARVITSLAAKKYTFHYPHIAPEELADKCLSVDPSQRTLPIGILAELATNL
ncbi:Myosin light chain kinase, smooth muscle [Exaiptasia diaphana]|nr:Myosin light chain kinase, smooth muscle [Exaiptasia diaphana]